MHVNMTTYGQGFLTAPTLTSQTPHVSMRVSYSNHFVRRSISLSMHLSYLSIHSFLDDSLNSGSQITFKLQS